MYQQVNSDAPLLQNMSEPWQLEKLKNSIQTRTANLTEATRFARWGNYGFSLAGGAIAGYGEAQQYGAAKGATVGAVDVGVNLISGFAGSGVGTVTTTVLGGLAAGAEEGSIIGSLGGPAGTLAGAVVGAAAGGVVAWIGGNVLSGAVNNWF